MNTPASTRPRWVVPALVVSLALVAVADVLLPESPIVVLLVVPVVVAGAFLSMRAVVWVTGAALALTVLTGLNPNDFAESDGWLQLAAVAGVGIAAALLARALDEYRRTLAAESEQYRMLAENATDVVGRISPTGTILWISPSVEQVLGWRPTDLVGSILHIGQRGRPRRSHHRSRGDRHR